MYYLKVAADIELKIVLKLENWEQEPFYEHVASHQDEELEEEELSREAILNREADILATSFLQGKSPKQVHLVPAAKVQVSINNHTVAHHYHRQLHQLAQQDSYWKYLADKHKFQDATMEDIDWGIFNTI